VVLKSSLNTKKQRASYEDSGECSGLSVTGDVESNGRVKLVVIDVGAGEPDLQSSRRGGRPVH
jgi:hypothetical protein